MQNNTQPQQPTLISFDAYTLPNNPHTHISINIRHTSMDFEIIVRLGGGSKKGESLVEFMKKNWDKYLRGVDVNHCAYMISIGAIPKEILIDWVNQSFSFSNQNPFDLTKPFNLSHLGEEGMVVDGELSEDERSFEYQIEQLKQQLVNER